MKMLIFVLASGFCCVPSASAQVVGCPYDGDGDGRVDIEDLYHITQNPVDLNGDGNADADDARCLEAYLRCAELREMTVGFGRPAPDGLVPSLSYAETLVGGLTQSLQLARTVSPDDGLCVEQSWTIELLGVDQTLQGPVNIAVDRDGFLWWGARFGPQSDILQVAPGETTSIPAVVLCDGSAIEWVASTATSVVGSEDPVRAMILLSGMNIEEQSRAKGVVDASSRDIGGGFIDQFVNALGNTVLPGRGSSKMLILFELDQEDPANPNFAFDDAALLVDLGCGAVTGDTATPLDQQPPIFPNYATVPNPSLGAHALIDYDGDGYSDLCVHDGDALFTIYPNNGYGHFNAPPYWLAFGFLGNFPNGLSFIDRMELVDFDNDGDRDFFIVYADVDGMGIYVIENRPVSDPLKDFLTGSLVPTETVHSSTHLVFGDFDGDGWTDFAENDRVNDEVVIHFNNAGVFTDVIRYGVDDDPNVLASSDLDGDGDAELIVTHAGADTVQVFRGSADRVLTPDPPILGTPFPGDGSPRGVAVGDLNGDGFSDAIVRWVTTGQVGFRILLQLPNGLLTPVGDRMTPVADKIKLGDLDGDGDDDVVAASFVTNPLDDEIVVWLSNGDGTLAEFETYSSGSGARDLVLADRDGDGDIDVNVLDQGGLGFGFSVGVLNNGDGTFFDEDRHNRDVQRVADFNGDGLPDVAASTNGFVLALGDGEGFEVRSFNSFDMTPFEIGDFDGDSDIDVLFLLSDVGPSGSLLLYVNDGTGLLAESFTSPLSDPDFDIREAVADLDGDGDLDLLLVDEAAQSRIVALMNDGDGRFTETPLLTVSSADPGVLLADLEDDGLPEMVLFRHNGTNVVDIYDNLGGGQFVAASSIVLQANADSTSCIEAIGAHDLNGDGLAEIVVGSMGKTTAPSIPSSPMEIHRNLGGLAFAFDEQYGWAADRPKFVDIDNDGDTDIVNGFSIQPSGADNRRALIWLNDGTGRFASGPFNSSDVVFVLSPASEFTIPVDVDGDGDIDLLGTDYIMRSRLLDP